MNEDLGVIDETHLFFYLIEPATVRQREGVGGCCDARSRDDRRSHDKCSHCTLRTLQVAPEHRTCNHLQRCSPWQIAAFYAVGLFSKPRKRRAYPAEVFAIAWPIMLETTRSFNSNTPTQCGSGPGILRSG